MCVKIWGEFTWFPSHRDHCHCQYCDCSSSSENRCSSKNGRRVKRWIGRNASKWRAKLFSTKQYAIFSLHFFDFCVCVCVWLCILYYPNGKFLRNSGRFHKLSTTAWINSWRWLNVYIMLLGQCLSVAVGSLLCTPEAQGTLVCPLTWRARQGSLPSWHEEEGEEGYCSNWDWNLQSL